MLFEYLPEIPPPPQEYLYKSLDEIRLNAFELSYFPGVYGSFLVRNKMAIEDALRPYFSFDVTNRFGYQYIGENMVVHKDIGRVETYNFILDTCGDDVTTVIYDDGI